jgi:hypothetical protein
VCHERECPSCWRFGWLAREAGTIAHRLRQEGRVRLGRRLVISVSLNPPSHVWDRFDTPAGYRRMRASAVRRARKAGLETFCLVFHRVRCADRWDPKTTDGPHFHALGFGWIKPKATDWVVKKHGLVTHLAGAARYILSHSARMVGSSHRAETGLETLTVTWYGRALKSAPEASEGPFCAICEVCYPLRLWIRVEYCGLDPPPPMPAVMNPGEWRAYELDYTGERRGRRVDVGLLS